MRVIIIFVLRNQDSSVYDNNCYTYMSNEYIFLNIGKENQLNRPLLKEKIYDTFLGENDY